MEEFSASMGWWKKFTTKERPCHVSNVMDWGLREIGQG
jgi:hypothetical protein